MAGTHFAVCPRGKYRCGVAEKKSILTQSFRPPRERRRLPRRRLRFAEISDRASRKSPRVSGCELVSAWASAGADVGDRRSGTIIGARPHAAPAGGVEDIRACISPAESGGTRRGAPIARSVPSRFDAGTLSLASSTGGKVAEAAVRLEVL